LLSFAYVYFFESRLFNALRVKKTKKFDALFLLAGEVVIDTSRRACVMSFPHPGRATLDWLASANGIAQIQFFAKS
jgi:hypothetical protein